MRNICESRYEIENGTDTEEIDVHECLHPVINSCFTSEQKKASLKQFMKKTDHINCNLVVFSNIQ